jgi:hypothetical protein
MLMVKTAIWHLKLTTTNSIICVIILQLDVEAYDSAYPENKATQRLIVSVIVNPGAPVFQQSNYRFPVNESQNPGFLVGTVLATDTDGVSFRLLY